MKNLEKYRGKSTRDDLPTTGRHIHSLHIRAFVSEGIDFTETESAHFDACRGCRLKVIDAFRELALQSSSGKPHSTADTQAFIRTRKELSSASR